MSHISSNSTMAAGRLIPPLKPTNEPLPPGMLRIASSSNELDLEADRLLENPLPGHVLYIALENQVRSMTTLMLIALGYSIDCASSGREALCHLDRKSFDVIVGDEQVADLGLCNLRRSVYSSSAIPGIAMTNSLSQNQPLLREIGFLEIVHKPIDIVVLHLCIQRVLQKCNSATESRTAQ